MTAILKHINENKKNNALDMWKTDSIIIDAFKALSTKQNEILCIVNENKLYPVVIA